MIIYASKTEKGKKIVLFIETILKETRYLLNKALENEFLIMKTAYVGSTYMAVKIATPSLESLELSEI